MGKDGDLSVNINNVSVASDNSSVEIAVSFPGQTGFCGGWYSPLMIFYDIARPKFIGESRFPLNPVGKIAWPEANAPGAFLVYDRDGDGKISKKDELFGDNSEKPNGFEKLKVFDSNKDGVIDNRDKKYSQLKLWQDKNGDGVSQKNELSLLSKSVQKISLNYKQIVRPLGLNAEEREVADIFYKGKNGKTKIGKIIDIWLAPRFETQLAQTK